MATTTAETPHAAHEDHHHEHPKFLAHHFDTPEQQFDSGKLGIWLFLVTEVLFFSGMFCAYALFRAARPDVFVYSSEFLNTTLGAVNTCVLLFSSLTMAWAVRASQLEQHRLLAGMLTATLCCASIFLGVKAVEYSHKWSIGLNPGFLYSYGTDHATSNLPFLQMLCALPALCVVGTLVWFIVSLSKQNDFQKRVAGPLLVVALSFFAGVVLGMFVESFAHHSDEHGSGAAHADAAMAEKSDLHEHSAGGNNEHGHAAEIAKVDEATTISPEPAVGLTAIPEETQVLNTLAKDKSNSGIRGNIEARETQLALAGAESGNFAVPVVETSAGAQYELSKNRYAATFFGIYYCMTGVHAVHILGGMIVLIWLLVRAVREDFNRQYFGPVDYVGLYWHLVDLIWIYLFPLLYLIR